MSPSDISLPETPIGSKPTTRQLAFLSSPIPDTVPAAKNTTSSPAATQIIATINQKGQEITAAQQQPQQLQMSSQSTPNHNPI